MLDETIITETPPLYSCYGHVGEHVRVPITVVRQGVIFRKMQKPSISLIMCTHNPSHATLERAIESVKLQSLDQSAWEFLLVDNASDEDLSRKVDLSWHPYGRYTREARLGLTPARLRGIAESKGDLIVFVDDDNLLAPDYLEIAQRIGREWPALSLWGGALVPEFANDPPAWTEKYWLMLAIRRLERDSWSNILGLHDANPFGAGICIRRSAAEAYMRRAKTSEVHLMLDRRGSELSSCGDLDMSFVAYENGEGTGVFRELSLVHLIPAERLTVEYLKQMMEETTHSQTHLLNLYGKLWVTRPSLAGWFIIWLKTLRLRGPDRAIEVARQKGLRRALEEILSASTDGSTGKAPPPDRSSIYASDGRS
jgi:glycosyltransferase involved in cell wall biosynthesis